MTNPSYHATVTPADVEFVGVTDIIVDDVLVDFTALDKSVAIPPTATQLKRSRTMYTAVTTIDHRVSGRGVDVIEFNVNGERHSVCALRARVWRIKH